MNAVYSVHLQFADRVDTGGHTQSSLSKC
jgi:hypothetical protein